MVELDATIQQLLANANEGAAPGRLSLRQLKQVIQAGGRAAGLSVQMEYKVRVRMFDRDSVGFVDGVWRRSSDGPVIVAWEIDAIDVGHPHVFGHEIPPPWRRNAVGIIRKLSMTNAPIKVHALYSYRDRPLSLDNSQLVQLWHDEQLLVPKQRVLVQSDVQLLAGSLKKIATEAAAI